jgi:hypothetical protein
MIVDRGRFWLRIPDHTIRDSIASKRRPATVIIPTSKWRFSVISHR